MYNIDLYQCSSEDTIYKLANDETESSDDTSTTEGADHIIDTDTDVEEEYLLGNQERNRNDIQIKKTDFQNSQEKLEKISNSKFLKDESPAEVNNIARRINTDLTMKDIAYLLGKLLFFLLQKEILIILKKVLNEKKN